jgi:FkbM family methyltransferase
MGFPFIRVMKKILVSSFFPHVRRSYSQSGEDIIISDLFNRLGISNPTYLDIGANDPVSLNNTYRLYTRGSRGVCIEPNPVMYKRLLQKRPKDVVINAGVAFDEKREADFYIFPHQFHGLNTFSKAEADFWEHTGNEEIGKHKPERLMSMKLMDINEILEKNFSPHPNLISIDVEGLDLEIAKMINFEKFKPEVFCLETLGFVEGNKEIRKTDIVDFFTSSGYFVYAETYINTIFCRKDAYKNLA